MRGRTKNRDRDEAIISNKGRFRGISKIGDRSGKEARCSRKSSYRYPFDHYHFNNIISRHIPPHHNTIAICQSSDVVT